MPTNGTKKMPRSHAIAVVGRLLPGIIPKASTLMIKSATPSSTTTHVGAVPASENGHNTSLPPETGSRRTVSSQGTLPSLSVRCRTKLEP